MPTVSRWECDNRVGHGRVLGRITDRDSELSGPLSWLLTAHPLTGISFNMNSVALFSTITSVTCQRRGGLTMTPEVTRACHCLRGNDNNMAEPWERQITSHPLSNTRILKRHLWDHLMIHHANKIIHAQETGRYQYPCGLYWYSLAMTLSALCALAPGAWLRLGCRSPHISLRGRLHASINIVQERTRHTTALKLVKKAVQYT